MGQRFDYADLEDAFDLLEVGDPELPWDVANVKAAKIKFLVRARLLGFAVEIRTARGNCPGYAGRIFIRRIS